MTSRRTILKGGTALTAALVASKLGKAFANEDEPTRGWGGRVFIDDDETISYNDLYNNPPALGRVEAWTLKVYEDPTNWRNTYMRSIRYGDILPITNVVRAEAPAALAHNPVWFEVDEGYVHSSFVVPSREVFHEPETSFPEWGFWGEITVPTSWQHDEPKMNSRRYYDLAFGEVFKVVDRVDEDNGRAWYRIIDDANPRDEWWVQARHVRRIPKSEFAQISPDVPPEEKVIEMAIREQILTCYEYGQPVFRTRFSSGTSFRDQNGTLHSFHTPVGEYYVQRKTPSRHMSGGEDINDYFDLPGVPWCAFFTPSGIAIHGTYWHNDYGQRRSHGCVNVTPDASKWIYLWSNPVVDYENAYHWTEREELDAATRIIVKATMEG